MKTAPSVTNRLTLVGMLSSTIGCNSMPPEESDGYSRINLSVEYATLWHNGTPRQKHETEGIASDATYSMSLKNGVWRLQESSVRADGGVHYQHSYGPLDKKDAQLILSDIEELTTSQKGKQNPVYPPGGPSARPLFSVSVQSSSSKKTWWLYESNDPQSTVYLNALKTMRTIARKHGNILPFTSKEIKEID